MRFCIIIYSLLSIIFYFTEVKTMSLKDERLNAGLTQQQMSDIMEIPKRTIENWESGLRKCPPYVERLIIKELREIASKNQVSDSWLSLKFGVR